MTGTLTVPGERVRATSTTGPGRRWVSHVAAFALFLIAGLLLTWPVWSDPLHRTITGGGGDAGLLLWFLAWTPHAVSHGIDPLFVTALNAPQGVNAMWNVSLLLPALVLAPVTLTLGPVLSLNLLLLAGPVLSSSTAYLALGRYVSSWLPRVAGALLFGFSPAVVAQFLGHPQVTLLFLVPVLLDLTVQCPLGRRRPVTTGALLGITAAAQIFIGEEVLAISALTGFLILLFLAVQRPGEAVARAGRTAVCLVTAAVVCGAIVAYPLYVQFLGPQAITGPVISGDWFKTDLAAVVTPTPLMAFHAADAGEAVRRFGTNLSETTGYLGWPVVVMCTAVAMTCWRRLVVRTAFLTGLMLLVLSLGTRVSVGGRRFDVAMPFALLARVPVLESLLPNRLALAVVAMAAVLVAVGVDRLSDVPRWGLPLAFGAAVVVLLPVTPRPLTNVQPVTVPALFRTGQVSTVIKPGETALVLPFPTPRDSRPMTWQAVSGLGWNMPGGYFIGPRYPRVTGEPPPPPLAMAQPRFLSRSAEQVERQGRIPEITAAYRAKASADLAYWNATTVMVGPHEYESELKAWMTILLGRSPERVAGMWVWTGVTPESVLHTAE